MSTAIPLERTYPPSSKTLTELLLHYFGQNPYHAQAKEIAGEISYQPVHHPLDAELVEKHLRGDVVLGSYQLVKDSNKVWWVGWDIDSQSLDIARRYTEKIILRLKDIPHAVEFSGGKGYHVLVFLQEPVAADKAKQLVDYIRDSEGLPKSGQHHVECFPKQGMLTKSQPMGSLLKIPLGRHPRTHEQSRFVDPQNGWEAGQSLSPEQFLQNTTSPDKLLELLHESGDTKKQIVELLLPHWVAGDRHNLALYLSGYLAHLGWGMQEAIDVIQAISIASGDADIRNRILAVEDTFRSVVENKAVRGFSGLVEMLPGATVRVLSDLATQVITPTLVKQLDAIRLQKAAAFEKIRAAVHAIWLDLQEQGEIVQTQNNAAYWYASQDHSLISLETTKWAALLLHNYGINPAESFGQQVTRALQLRAVSEARIVKIQNRTVWDGHSLYINLGGAAVYKLDGRVVSTEYNGECGYLFRTDLSQDSVEPDFDAPVEIWSKLVDDLSFNKSSDAPATPEEQREMLKAWIMAFFFQELMPTKPLLLSMGVPGSGKTTAMRRVLKVLESPQAEVLEVAGDKPDSLRASIATHRLLVLDNLEKSGVRWLVDTLNRLATGANIELRQLYKTNEVYVLKPNCFVAMTAVSMPFSEETLFSRILPLEMSQLQNPLPEHMLQKDIQDNLAGLWADMLGKLNKIVLCLQNDASPPPPIASRLADFTVFCKRIEQSGVVEPLVLMKGLRSLVDRQRMALVEASPFVTVLEEWLNSKEGETESKKEHSFSELFSILEPLARAHKLSWRWNNPAALSRHVIAMSEPLKKLYRAEFTVAYEEHLRREVHKVRFV